MSQNHHTKTALIVEDSPTQAMHLQHLLSQNGLPNIWAHNGEEGLHYAQRYLPNIIVMDIELPGMDGIQLCKLLKESQYTSSIPIILLTHLNDIETTRYGFQAGAIKFIPKDEFSDAALLETLKIKGLLGIKLETA